MYGFDGDPKRDGDERGGVDKSREDAGALVAEGARVVRGTRLKVDRGKAEHEGEKSETLWPDSESSASE